MKIFGWLADRSGCGYYRLMLPGAQLAKAGHSVMLDGTLPAPAKHGECDVIVGQRVCNEGASVTWQKLARAGHTKLVFETDDDLLSVDPSNKHAARFYDEDACRRYTENLRVADLVTTTTDALAERCAEINPNVVVLPNMIPAWMLDHERPSGSDLVTVGWRGSLSHDRDFGELAKPLRRFLQHPDNRDRAEFHAMGAQYHERVKSNHSRLRWTGWYESVSDFLRAVDFDLAVIPLRPSAFNDCKSDLAVVEMSALGVPVIASDTGPYASTDAPILRVSSPRQWSEELESLATDEGYRTVLGKEAREWAAGRTIEAHAWRWEGAYSS